MEAATVIQWHPLGEMLVEQGLLTLPELEDALDEQERTGKRLGAILVARKIVAGAVLTTILAEQVGVELETQGGFGSGLFTKIARRNGGGDPLGRAPAGAATPPELVIADAPTEPPLAFADELLIELDHVRAELDAERARLVELEAELDALRAQATARPKRRPSARAAAS